MTINIYTILTNNYNLTLKFKLNIIRLAKMLEDINKLGFEYITGDYVKPFKIITNTGKADYILGRGSFSKIGYEKWKKEEEQIRVRTAKMDEIIKQYRTFWKEVENVNVIIHNNFRLQ